MTPSAATVPATGSTRDGVIAAVAATLVSVGAVAGKAWCGVPASPTDLYLRYCYTDVVPLFGTERLDVGAVPYLDHAVEYPPLTGLWMWLANLPADTAAGFLAATAVLLVAAAAVTGWLLGREVGWPRAAAFALAPTLLVSGAVNWDLPSVALATAGLVLFRRGHDRASAVALGLGAAAKAWPALLVPCVALDVWHRDGPAAAGRFIARAAGAWAVVNVPVALIAPEGWWEFLRLSRERNLDWDSLWRVVPNRLGTSFGEGTDVDALIAAVTLGGIAVLLLHAHRHGPDGQRHLVGLPVVAWFLVVGKVWSPQFTLWLLPLLALSAPTWPMLGVLAVADVAVTATRFPYLGTVIGLDGPDATWFEWAVVVRAVVVAGIAWLTWRRTIRIGVRRRTTDTGGPTTDAAEPTVGQTAREASRSSQ